MRLRTGLVLALVLGTLAAGAVAGFTASDAALQEQWISDTVRDNRVNHHAVGVGPNGTVVAPIAALQGSGDLGPHSCTLARLDADSGAVQWRAGVPAANCTTHALTAPGIADVDGNGDREVLVGTTENALRVHDAATGREEWRISLPSYGYGRPTVANVTASPGPEVVAVDIEGNAVVVANRTVQWRASLDASTWAPPIVTDVDGDGRQDALFGTNAGTSLYSANGDREWRYDGAGTTTAVAHLDGEAKRVFATDTGTVTALDGATGNPVWTQSVDGVPSVRAVAPGDPPLVLVGVSGGAVRALDATSGEVVWTTQLPGSDRQGTWAPTLGDLDGDGDAEAVVAASDGTVAVLDPRTGAQLSTYDRDVPIWTHVTVADADDDPDDEVFVRYGDGRVAMLEYE